jgi:hypothetical protein
MEASENFRTISPPKSDILIPIKIRKKSHSKNSQNEKMSFSLVFIEKF